MHDAAFRALEMDWSYDLLDVPPEGLKAAVAALRAPDVAGANVTIPYKQAVMEHLDAIAPDAMRARAVNTIVNDGGRLGGFNTDIPAIRGAVEQVGVEPRSANAVILGGGGAARATAAALEGSHLTELIGGTPLVRKARSLGLPTVDGWQILLAQGTESFLLWTGRAAPVDVMRDTLQP